MTAKTVWVSPPWTTRPGQLLDRRGRCCYTKTCWRPVVYRVKMAGRIDRYCTYHFPMTGLKPARDYR